MIDLDRQKLAQALRRKINKDYGAGTVGYAKSLRRIKVDRYSTGSLSLDFALGGGVAAGRVTLFYGERSSGKTTTTLRVIADAQARCANCLRRMADLQVEKVTDPETGDVDFRAVATCDCYQQGLFKPVQMKEEKADAFKARIKEYGINSYEETRVLFVDAENALDFGWAAAIGVDLDRLLHVVPHTAEDAIDIYVEYMNSGMIDLLVLDSIAALTPTAEVESSSADWQQGLGARLTNKFVRMTGAAAVSVAQVRLRPPTQIWINQVRQKIGQYYGDGKTLPNGKAQWFAASAAVEFEASYTKDNAREIFGTLAEAEKMKIADTVVQRFRVEKNKTGTARGEGRFCMFVSGPHKGEIDEFNYLMHHAERYEILRKEGSNKWILGDQEFKTKTAAQEEARKPVVQANLRAQILRLMNAELDA